jgi:hypothetical protein
VRCRRADLDLWIEIRLSGGWRRSGHKVWVQVSILRPGKPRYSRMTFTKMPSGSSPSNR